MPRDFAEFLEKLPAEALPAEPPRKLSERTQRWIELALVLSVAFAGSIFGSIQILMGTRGSSNLGPEWGNSILHEVIGLSLLGYLLYRRGRRFSDLGLRWSFRDLIRGALLVVAGYVAWYCGCIFLQWLHGLVAPSLGGGVTAKELFGRTTAMTIVLMLINPFYEELIVRAYLMTEIRELTGSWKLATVASVAVQTSYHLYYGWIGALSLGCMFLVYSIYYARTRRATPLVLAHGFLDLLLALWP